MTGKVIAVVPAAGIGKRLGAGTNKPFLSLLGRPLLLWTLDVLQESAEIKEIIPVLRETDLDTAARLIEEHRITKVKRIAPGGRERQDSVYNGLRLLDGHDGLVLIHDGVRPLVTPGLISETISAMDGFDGAVAAVPVKDTIKEALDGVVQGTLRRDTLWAVQTPQVFPSQVIRKAYECAFSEGFFGTDDAALVERIGGRVRIVAASYDNIKITTPEDVPVAEMLLMQRSKG